MVAIEVLAVSGGIGALFRILQMDGWDLGVYWKSGVLQMGAIMTLVLGVIAAVGAVYTGFPGMNTVFGAFAVGFGVPFAIDQIVTKSPVGGDSPTRKDAIALLEGASDTAEASGEA